MSNAFDLTPAQQAAGVDRIDESIALLSGAGCGKTFVLARRFTELLLACEGDERQSLSQLVALTFTDKAALEMSQRVRTMLTARADRATGPERLRLLRWIDELPEARISTIHGFCSALLRSRAIEAGVDPNFAVCADSLLVGRLVAEAADRALLAAVESERPEVARLLGSYTFARLARAVAALVDMRTAFNADDYGDAERIVERWDAQIRCERDAAWQRMDADEDLPRMLAELVGLECTDDGDRLLPLRDELLDAAGWILADRAERTAESFARLDLRLRNYGSDKNWGGDKGAAKAVRDAMKAVMEAFSAYAEFAEDIGEPDRQAAATLAALVELAGEAKAIYEAEKRSRGLLDFTDLLARTAQLLHRAPGVRKALAERIRQLLIDECQDTDAFQVALLTALVVGDGSDTTGPPPAGRLFVVGDAKQSIYRFRGAQVGVFQAMCNRMGPGNTERLDLSFRTHAAGVAFVNDLFGKLMGDAYSPIEAHRTVCPPAPSVEILLAAGADGADVASASDATAAQAAVTAQRIREMLDNRERIVRDAESGDWRPVRPGDIAILFARMTASLAYERELQRCGIPYYVVAGSGFFRRQEVLDVLNALAVVDNAFDDVAFVGVLRSSLFGLDDNAMMHLAQAVEPPYLPALSAAMADGRLDGMLRQPLGASRLEAVADAVDLLTTLRCLKDAIGVDEIIQRLLDATGYEATLLAQPQGKRMVGNVRMLLDQARAAGEAGTALADFLTQMKELTLGEARYEQAAVAGETEDVVRIMTIHKAKGLEFPVVVLPDLNAARRVRRDDLLIRTDWGLTWTPGAAQTDRDDEDGPERPLSARLAWQREERDQQAEEVRKWYVAATRHEDHLVLIGADWRDRDGRFRNGECFLAQMDEHLHLAAIVDDGAETIAYGDGRYRAVVRRVGAGATAPPASGQTPPGRSMIRAATNADEFTRAVASAARARPSAAPPLVGPVSADVGAAVVAVSTLGDFERCEMQYRWRYDLRVPTESGVPAGGGAPIAALGPATLGTLYHRCMELLDVRQPQAAADLVVQAAVEMDLLEAPGLDAVSREFAAMLAGFEEHELRGQLAGARTDLRELDFEMRVGPALLRGQIDLLFEDAEGAWHIVDYKSDRVGPEGLAAHAERYELQMLTYALAASRHLGQPPTGAVLYFLRPAAICRIDTSPARLGGAEQRIGDIARRLITARRSGHFRRCEPANCGPCPYTAFCRTAE